MSSHDDLRAIALTEFTTAGYASTSLQRIAEIAGLSKSSVLYHYASKEALLEAAISPAIDRMDAILESIEGHVLDAERRAVFLGEFTNFLLEHRHEVHMFINQGPTIAGVPVVDRANRLVVRLAEFFRANSTSTEDKMRFGIALGGAAYMLCTIDELQLEDAPLSETRAALVKIMTELLAPIRSQPVYQE